MESTRVRSKLGYILGMSAFTFQRISQESQPSRPDYQSHNPITYQFLSTKHQPPAKLNKPENGIKITVMLKLQRALIAA